MNQDGHLLLHAALLLCLQLDSLYHCFLLAWEQRRQLHVIQQQDSILFFANTWSPSTTH
jgi:hypothetical protein